MPYNMKHKSPVRLTELKIKTFPPVRLIERKMFEKPQC